MKYLIEMTPIDSYAFSGESSFLNPGETKTRRSSYHVDSELLPPQTTVLGTLRRCLLEWNKLFRDDKQYSEHEKEEMKKLIGAQPFQIDSMKFELGAIKGISCLFLTQRTQDEEGREKEHWLFPIPKNAKQNEKAMQYKAMPWDRQKMEDNEISLKGYDVKEYLASGFVAVPFSRYDALPAAGVEAVFANGLKTSALIPQHDIFISYQQSAVRKVEDDKEKGYRLHERVVFNRNNGKFAFAVLAEIDEEKLMEGTWPLVVSMGARGSLFEVQATPVRQAAPEEKTALPQKECCIAVLSPLALPDDWRDKVAFAIISKQKIRQMVPIPNSSYAYQHDTTLRYFAAPGSVLYLKAEDAQAFLDEVHQNEYLYKAGFNHMIMMDGEELA